MTLLARDVDLFLLLRLPPPPKSTYVCQRIQTVYLQKKRCADKRTLDAQPFVLYRSLFVESVEKGSWGIRIFESKPQLKAVAKDKVTAKAKQADWFCENVKLPGLCSSFTHAKMFTVVKSYTIVSTNTLFKKFDRQIE